MSTFTKEQLIAAACSRIAFARQMLRENQLPLAKRKWEIELSLSEIALASLEAEAVSVFKINHESSLIKHIKRVVSETNAPPAPVSVPDLTALDKLAGEMLNHAMNCERRVAVAYTHCAHRLAEEVRDLRDAMLQGDDGNSPLISDGWKLVPIELTGDMTNAMSEAILDDLHNVDVWRSVLAAAPKLEVK